MTASGSEGALRARLLARVAELTGRKAERLTDEDGDMQIRDSPFGIWARVERRAANGEWAVVLLAIPLLEVPPVAGELIAKVLAGTPLDWKFGHGAIHLFWSWPESVLDKLEALKSAVASVAEAGESVRAAVQPVHGGLTAEQHRVLKGWRGPDPGFEALLGDIAQRTGGSFTRQGDDNLHHAWDPRRESPPILVIEERKANRSVTIGPDGTLRFRSTAVVSRAEEQGALLTIDVLGPAATRAWARRLGTTPSPGLLNADEVRLLKGKTWDELTAAFQDLPREANESWRSLQDDGWGP